MQKNTLNKSTLYRLEIERVILLLSTLHLHNDLGYCIDGIMKVK